MPRTAYVPRPRCPHRAAVWEAYLAADREPPDEQTNGYCPACTDRLFHSDDPWPPEVWAWMNYTAAQHPGGKHAISKPAPLPPAPKPRQIKPAQWIAQAIKAYSPDKGTTEATIVDAQRRAIGPDEHGRMYVITATNGYTLIAEPGTTDRPPIGRGISIAAGRHWIDLPPDFHPALRRVRLLANERSGAIRITVGGDFARIVLHASCAEYGEATETIDNGAINQSIELPETVCCLNADYLDAICGCWPVRWYVRPPMERRSITNPHSTYTEEHPQLFCPSGTDARVLIMPMRI